MNINFLVILLIFVITLPIFTSSGELINCLDRPITYHKDGDQDNFEWNGKSYSTKQDALNAIDNHYPGGVIKEGNNYAKDGKKYYNVQVCVEKGVTQSKAMKTTQFSPRPAKYAKEIYSNKERGGTLTFGVIIPPPAPSPYYRRRK